MCVIGKILEFVILSKKSIDKSNLTLYFNKFRRQENIITQNLHLNLISLSQIENLILKMNN